MAESLSPEVAAERERCARIVEALIISTEGEEDRDDAMRTVAAAIRDGDPAE